MPLLGICIRHTSSGETTATQPRQTLCQGGFRLWPARPDSQHFSSVIAPPAPQETFWDVTDCAYSSTPVPDSPQSCSCSRLHPQANPHQQGVRIMFWNPVSPIQPSGSEPGFQKMGFYFSTPCAQQLVLLAAPVRAVSITSCCCCPEVTHAKESRSVKLPHTGVAALSHWHCTGRYLTPSAPPPQPCHICLQSSDQTALCSYAHEESASPCAVQALFLLIIQQKVQEKREVSLLK